MKTEIHITKNVEAKYIPRFIFRKQKPKKTVEWNNKTPIKGKT